jgi:hypothetical protein
MSFGTARGVAAALPGARPDARCPTNFFRAESPISEAGQWVNGVASIEATFARLGLAVVFHADGWQESSFCKNW